MGEGGVGQGRLKKQVKSPNPPLNEPQAPGVRYEGIPAVEVCNTVVPSNTKNI